jgi:hypothetical protein
MSSLQRGVTTMVKKILIVIGVILVFLMGLMSAPERPIKYNEINVKGYDYGLENGSVLLQGAAIQVKRIFTQPDLLFLEEADGTLHLYVKKDEPSLLQEVRANQNSRLYSFRCFYFNMFLRLMSLRNGVFQFVENLFGQESPPAQKTPDKNSEG